MNTQPLLPQIQQQPTIPYRQASLFVGNLSPEINDVELHETFEKAFEVVGKERVQHVISARVCRDLITRRSLGYGYVNFRDYEDAEKALEALNYIPIGQSKRPCHIMWSQRDPSTRKSGVGNVIVKNLDKSIDSKTLHDTFSKYGNILSCRVMYDEEGNSKGYGFVQFSNDEEAQNALRQADKSCFQGTTKQINVLKHKPIKELIQKINEYKKNFVNVYVKNIPLSYTIEDFSNLFSKYGNVTSQILMRDETGKSKGFGYVCFKQHQSAQTAVEELNGKKLEGAEHPLYLARHQKKAEREEEKRRAKEQKKREYTQRTQNLNLYVKNIDESWTENTLRELFLPFGEIKSCKLSKDNKDMSKGFGFVCFSSPEESQRAMNEMNGKVISHGKPLYVNFHQSRDVRRQFLEAQRMKPFYPPMGAYPPFQQYPYVGGRLPMRTPIPPYYNNYPFQQRHMQRSTVRPTSGGPPRSSGPRPPQQGGQPQSMQQVNQRVPPSNRMPIMSQQKNTSNVKFVGVVKNTGQADTHEIRKREIGDQLYYYIQGTSHNNYASKVTGMLMEMGYEELSILWNDKGLLNGRIAEAVNLIDNSN